MRIEIINPHTDIFTDNKKYCSVVACGFIRINGDEYKKVIDVVGKSKCSPDDKFDYEFGEQLATVRAYQKYYKKIEKELIKYSYKNSRKILSIKLIDKMDLLKDFEYLEIDGSIYRLMRGK